MCSHINVLIAFPGPNGRTQVKNPYERNPLKLPVLAPNRDRELSLISFDLLPHSPLMPRADRPSTPRARVNQPIKHSFLTEIN